MVTFQQFLTKKVVDLRLGEKCFMSEKVIFNLRKIIFFHKVKHFFPSGYTNNFFCRKCLLSDYIGITKQIIGLQKNRRIILGITKKDRRITLGITKNDRRDYNRLPSTSWAYLHHWSVVHPCGHEEFPTW